MSMLMYSHSCNAHHDQVAVFSLYKSNESVHKRSPVLQTLTPECSGGKTRGLHRQLARGLLFSLLKRTRLYAAIVLYNTSSNYARVFIYRHINSCINATYDVIFPTPARTRKPIKLIAYLSLLYKGNGLILARSHFGTLHAVPYRAQHGFMCRVNAV